MKRKAVIINFFLLIGSACLSTGAVAQCKKIAQSHISEFGPYVFSGQINTIKLQNGQTGNLTGTLLGGQQYKIILAGEQHYGPYSFRILDKEKNVLFDNKEHDNSQAWVFIIDITDNYTMELGVPSHKKESAPAGPVCVGLIVGFMPAVPESCGKDE